MTAPPSSPHETVQANSGWSPYESPAREALNREYDMKVRNNQKASEADDGVSRDTLNDRQRKDAQKQRPEEATRGKKSENEVGKQAEG